MITYSLKIVYPFIKDTKHPKVFPTFSETHKEHSVLIPTARPATLNSYKKFRCGISSAFLSYAKY